MTGRLLDVVLAHIWPLHVLSSLMPFIFWLARISHTDE